MNRLRAAAVLAALPLAIALASCQLVAGLDGIKPNDASSTGEGGAHTSSASHGSGGGGAGGGATGGGGSSPLVPPTCAWVTTLSSSAGAIQDPLVAGAADGSGYVAGTSPGCMGLDCPFVTSLGPGGVLDTTTLPVSGGEVDVDTIAAVSRPSSGLALAGTVDIGQVTLPGGMTVGSTVIFVASLAPDLMTTQWAQQIGATTLGFSSVAADPNSEGVVLASTVTGANLFGSCSIPDGDVFLAGLAGADGSCQWVARLGGQAAEQANVLRTSDNGFALLGGVFHGDLTFPSNTKETSTEQIANYYGVFRLAEPMRGVDIWHRKIESPNVALTGGSVSPKGTHLAISGMFQGPVPGDLGADAAFSNCGAVSGATQVAFVKTYSGITKHPKAEIELCLGASGSTNIDVVVHDDGSLVVGGSTDGAFDLGQLHVAAKSPEPALFLFKIDEAGALLWGMTRAPAMSSQNIIRLSPLKTGGVLAEGSFSGSIDFGGLCQRMSAGPGDVFVAAFGP